jgi:hypothetical protein
MKQTKRQPDKAVKTTTTEDYVPDVNLLARITALGSMAEYVEAVVTALEHNLAADSPAEDFLTGICLLYSRDLLTPERADDYLEDFRRNLKNMIDNVRHFVRQNPAVIDKAS